ncbi:hypothetical protein [Nocardia sp. NPDC052566]|uniref:hypothetical protein n=1 Tax=Nocardia sp. NPDC052566 TaxID=3364330 RepID=UPI0037C7D170
MTIGTRLAGKWIGFGKNFDINSGPWELVFQNADTTKTATTDYDRPPDFDTIARLSDD